MSFKVHVQSPLTQGSTEDEELPHNSEGIGHLLRYTRVGEEDVREEVEFLWAGGSRPWT